MRSSLTTDGREYLDCFAGISVVNAGHCNPEVIAAAKAQMDKLIHCSSYSYYVQPVADLAEKLASITPGRLQKTFFGNGGAEAIEGALKLARLYTGKSDLIALQGSFHGRSMGALSVTGNQGRKREAVLISRALLSRLRPMRIARCGPMTRKSVRPNAPRPWRTLFFTQLPEMWRRLSPSR